MAQGRFGPAVLDPRAACRTLHAPDAYPGAKRPGPDRAREVAVVSRWLAEKAFAMGRWLDRNGDPEPMPLPIAPAVPPAAAPRVGPIVATGGTTQISPAVPQMQPRADMTPPAVTQPVRLQPQRGITLTPVVVTFASPTPPPAIANPIRSAPLAQSQGRLSPAHVWSRPLQGPPATSTMPGPHALHQWPQQANTTSSTVTQHP